MQRGFAVVQPRARGQQRNDGFYGGVAKLAVVLEAVRDGIEKGVDTILRDVGHHG